MIGPEIHSNAKDFMISFVWNMQTSTLRMTKNNLRQIMPSISLEGKNN